MGSVNASLIPASTGLTLGNPNQLWTAYLENVFLETIVSNSLGVATTGTLRLASGDSIVWRDAADENDLALAKTEAAVGTVPADLLTFPGGIQGPFISSSVQPASTGELRLADEDQIVFRNNADSGDVVALKHNSDDTLTVGGSAGVSVSSLQGTDISLTGTISATTLDVDRGNVTLDSITVLNNETVQGNLVVTGNQYFNDVTQLVSRISKYKNIATVGDGVPYQVATADLTGQTGTVNTTALYTPAAIGLYRVLAYLKMTTTGTSPVIGPVVISYSDGTDAVAQNVTMALVKQDGSVGTTNNGNATNTVLSGSLIVWARNGTAISYGIGTSGTFGAAEYEAHLRLECLG